MLLCEIDDCHKALKSRGFCSMHYERVRKHGDPHANKKAVRGSASFNWRGDNVGYDAIHRRLRVYLGSATTYACFSCGNPAAHWAYNHADPNEKLTVQRGLEIPYSTDMSFYVPACVPCHYQLDH